MTRSENGILKFLGIIAAFATVIGLLFGDNLYSRFVASSSPGISNLPGRPGCSQTTEVGPWSSSESMTLNPERDVWVQADF